MENISENLLDLLKGFSDKYNELKKRLPYHINVIDELHINENAHSRILCKLLQYQSECGKYDFLESLLSFISKKKGVKSFSEINVESPNITQEEERIDLWVKDREYAIIFENKVYDANDQEAQIARYINKTRACPFDDERIYIIYMPSSEGVETSDQTWVYENENLKEKFKERYVNLSFRDDILGWLKDYILPNIRYKDLYLHSAISQYVDYLEGMFDKRNINKIMNMELKNYLEKELGLNKISSDNEKIRILTTKESEIQKLLAHINEEKQVLMANINKRELDKWNENTPQIKKIAEKVAQNLGLMSEIKYDSESSYFYIRFYREGWNLSIIIEKYDIKSNNQLFIYIGIPGEQTVNMDFKKYEVIFGYRSYRGSHPYGWEWLDKYNQKAELFLNAINNGEFETYLNEKIAFIIKEIDDKKLPMS